MKIRVGSRESRLAVIQSEIIINSIKKCTPDIEIELITMKTTGDKILDRTLDKVGGKGLFVKELDIALIENRVDITVHSLKDMPMEINPKIPITAFSERENPYDVLVLPKGIDKIDFNKSIGCSSMRRTLQLKNIYSNAEIKPVRGNVLTRLAKLDNGEYSALMLAEAGLKRLGLTNRISRIFTAEEMLPAAGQGIIAVQTRKGENYDFLKEINCQDSEICAKAERAFVRRLNGGCSSPVAAYAAADGDKIRITGLNVINGEVIIKSAEGNKSEGEFIGKSLAEEMI